MNFKTPFKVLTTAALIGTLSLSAVAPGAASAAEKTVTAQAETPANFAIEKVILVKGDSKISVSFDTYIDALGNETALNGYELAYVVAANGEVFALDTYVDFYEEGNTEEEVVEKLSKAGKTSEVTEVKDGAFNDGKLEPVEDTAATAKADLEKAVAAAKATEIKDAAAKAELTKAIEAAEKAAAKEDATKEELEAAKAELTKAVAAAKKADAEAALEAKVESVTAINGTTVEVKFNKAVDKNTISVDDFTFKALDTISGNTIVTSGGAENVEGKLSEDGKTYTITTNNGASSFSGRYDVSVAANAIKSTDNKSFAKYAETLKFEDKTAAKVKSVETSDVDTDANTATVTVKFDEKVLESGSLTINGKSYDATGFAAGDTEAVFEDVKIEAGKSYQGEVVGTTDIVGNVSESLPVTVTAAEDKTAPTVEISAKEDKITLKFSEKLAADPTVKLNGASTGLVLAKDTNDKTETTYTVDASAVLTSASTTFLNNAKVEVSVFEDLAGNPGKTTNKTVNLTADVTAPKLVSKELLNNKLYLKFDEPVVDDGSGVVDVTGLNLSFVDADGVIINLTGTSLSGELGKDINGNGSIDVGTEEEKYVTVSIADSASQIIKNSNLVKGEYTFSWDKGAFADAAGNDVAAAEFTLSPTTSTDVDATVTYSATNHDKNNQILVTYSEAMDASATTAANYKLGGKALPTGTKLAFYDDKEHVLITLPEGSISSNGKRVLAVTGVKSLAGNTQDTEGQTTVSVDLKESVLPTLTKVNIDSAVQATAVFSEDITTTSSAAVTGVTVKLDGKDVTSTVSLAVVDGELVITDLTDLTNDSKITLEFKNANIEDLNGNLIANN